MGTTKYELFEFLEAINPRWQIAHHTLRDAACAYDLLPEYYAYMLTEEGLQRTIRLKDVPDTVAQNKAERKLRERMSRRPSRANSAVYDEMDMGYLSDSPEDAQTNLATDPDDTK